MNLEEHADVFCAPHVLTRLRSLALYILGIQTLLFSYIIVIMILWISGTVVRWRTA